MLSKSFEKNCIKFYITAANEIRKRFPIDDEFLSKLCVFEPHLVLVDNDRNTSFKSVLFIAQKLGGFDEEGFDRNRADFLDHSHSKRVTYLSTSHLLSNR